MECVRLCRSTCCHTDKTPYILAVLQTAHDYPTPVSFHRYQQQNARGYMPRPFAPPNNRPGKVHTAWRPCDFSRNVLTCFPSFPDFPPICFLLDLLQLLLLPLLLLWSAHGHAVRLKIPLPLRTARVPTIILPSRGFSCCCTSQLPQGYHPHCVQLRLHHRRVSTMVVQQSSLQHQWRVAIDPHRTPLVPRARC